MSAIRDNKVFIGIGSNMGDKAHRCVEAMAHVIEDHRASPVAVSSLYVTSPVSPVPQEDFINCAIAVIWDGSPIDLLAFLNRIERDMGRVRRETAGPRVIDLDILLFGGLILATPSLTIPHPELHKRKFALLPCIEMDPLIVHPLFHKGLASFPERIDGAQRISVHTPAGHVGGLVESERNKRGRN